MKKTALISAVLVLAGFSGAAFANTAILKANNEIGIAATGTLMNYQEHITPGPSDTESGWMPGFGVKYSLMQNLMGLNNAYVAIHFNRSAGNINYRGAVQTADGDVPVTATDKATIYNVTGRVGMGMALSNDMMVTPYVVGGYQHWNRDLIGPDGYTEDYGAGLVGLGAKFQYAPTSNLVLSATPEFMAIVGGGVKGNVAGVGRAKFGTSGEEKLSLDADYAVAENVHIYGGLSYTHFNYTGGPAPVYGNPDIIAAQEPPSSTNHFGLQLGVAYNFY